MKVKFLLFLSCLFLLNLTSIFAQQAVSTRQSVSPKQSVSQSPNYFDMGLKYYNGNGVTKDYAEAFKYFKKSAEQGYASGQDWLGYMYQKGYGVTQNYAEALKWYRKAAEQNYRSGQFNLGYMYDHGLGVTQDYAEACKWYRKAAEQGHANAQANLGYLTLYGKGVAKNQNEAFKWYKKSAEQGSAISQNWLAYLYENGYGVAKNETEALKWYKKSAEQGNEKSKKKVAELEGKNGTQNSNIATIDWLAFKPTTTDKRYTLNAGIKSTSKIESWSLTVNGIVERGINSVPNDGYDLKINKTLNLAEGNNKIKIEVRNAGGVARSEKTVTYTASTKPVFQEKRIALVIGNANYVDSDKRLRNPVNDATDLAAKLQKLGFTVIRSLDQNRQGLEAAIADFGRKARNYDVALCYYAGHGVSTGGRNYMIPVDANLPEESSVKYNCTDVNMILDLLEEAHCQMKIIILDACRNNPFARSWHRSLSSEGLSNMNAPKGTFIAFSTAPGDVAQDGAGRNSPYTTALLQTLDIPNLSITDFFQEVLEKVATKTNDRQTPWTSNSFRGKFVFNKR
jgi:TPR repeat protein